MISHLKWVCTGLFFDQDQLPNNLLRLQEVTGVGQDVGASRQMLLALERG